MRRAIRSATVLLLCAFAAALLGACGSATKTVSVSASPALSGTPTSTSSTGTTTAPAAPPTTTAATSPAETTPSATRTATAPAFTGSGDTRARGTTAATATLRAHGYTPNDTSDYHPNQTLQVLLGTRTGSGDGYDQRAFFFLDGRYLGTDASQPSARVRVVSQTDAEVTLAYPLYRPHDALCCPSGGEAKVRFQLDNGKLTPLDAIPPASSQSGLSRQ